MLLARSLIQSYHNIIPYSANTLHQTVKARTTLVLILLKVFPLFLTLLIVDLRGTGGPCSIGTGITLPLPLLRLRIIRRQFGNTRISYVICLVLVNKDTP